MNTLRDVALLEIIASPHNSAWKRKIAEEVYKARHPLAHAIWLATAKQDHALAFKEAQK